MPLSFRCPGCGVQHTVSGKMAGKQVRCKCGVLMGIPSDPRLAANSPAHADTAPTPAQQQVTQPSPRQPSARQPSARQPSTAKQVAAKSPPEIPTDCPGCGKRRVVPATFSGKKVRCPCGTSFQIFGATSAATPQTPTSNQRSSQNAGTHNTGTQPTNTAPNRSGSLFDELTDGDLSGDFKLQPPEATVANPSGDQLSRALSNPSLKSRMGSTGREAEAGERNSPMESIGYGVFFVLCGWPGLELNGFGFGLPITLPIALACATLGGLIGGALVCPRPIAAGLIGGALAGPPGLVAVYLYTIPRESVYSIELVIVQGLASLPGVGVGFAIRKLLTPVGRSRSNRF